MVDYRINMIFLDSRRELRFPIIIEIRRDSVVVLTSGLYNSFQYLP